MSHISSAIFALISIFIYCFILFDPEKSRRITYLRRFVGFFALELIANTANLVMCELGYNTSLCALIHIAISCETLFISLAGLMMVEFIFSNVENVPQNAYIVRTVLYGLLLLLNLLAGLNYFTPVSSSINAEVTQYFHGGMPHLSLILIMYILILVMVFLLRKELKPRIRKCLILYVVLSVADAILAFFGRYEIYGMPSLISLLLTYRILYIQESFDVKEALKSYQKTLGSLNGTQMGMWNLLIKDDTSKLYADAKMEELVGVAPGTDPSIIYETFVNSVPIEEMDTLKNYIEDLSAGKQAEIIYPYNHPSLGFIYVRCGGIKDDQYTGEGILLRGYHQDVTTQVTSKKKNTAVVEALSRDYINVFLLNRIQKTVRTQKLGTSVMSDLGFDPNELIPYDCFINTFTANRTHPDDVGHFSAQTNFETVEKNINTTGEHSFTFRILVKGQITSFQAKFVELVGTDEIIVGLRNIDSIVEQEAQQRQVLEDALAVAKQANTAKSVFLSNMSHDIRTPMNAIIGYTKLAQDNLKDSAKVENYLNRIHTSSNHLLQLINDILDMSKIEAGKTVLNTTVTDLKAIIEEIKDLATSLTNEREHTFQVSMDIQDNFVFMDNLRFKQIIINLLSNAYKYTPNKGTIAFRITQQQTNNPNVGKYRFSVKDNGIGMSQEYAKTIFEAFSREANTTKSKTAGTGLGMAITKALVDLMGGTIQVITEKDKGSEFIVDLSFALDHEQHTETQSEETTISSQSLFDGIHFLAAEDNGFNADILVEILEERGAVVDLAENGQIALEKFNNSKPGQYDAILMDVQMPVMDGYEATKAIRASNHPDARQILIVAMTANAFDEDIKASKDAGMDLHLAKPLNLELLEKTLASKLVDSSWLR